MKLVSIVVPVYNIEDYIENCIESLVTQTYEKIEILLTDDGSTDNSGKICDAYAEKDSRIRVLHKENGGLSDARNQGLLEAKGEYLFFIDGDDSVAPQMVEKAVSYAEKHRADMVIFDYESVEQGTGRRDIYHFGLPEDRVLNVKDTPELLLKTPSACCRMYAKELWKNTGITYPKGLHYEDLATIPRITLKAERIVYTGGEPLYYYMLRQGSIMRSNNFERSYKDRTYVLDYLKNYFQEEGAEERYCKEIEYLFFEHGYFVPSKEIILADSKSIWLSKFKQYTLENYPEIFKNPYMHQLSKKDKILLFFMKREQYGIMKLLSAARRAKDSIKKEN